MDANVLVETKNLSREEWLEYRRMGIGGSDVAGVLGISKWSSPISIWLDKTGQADPVEENEAMRWGTLLEPIVRNQFADTTGKVVKKVKAILQHPEYPFMLANVDGITTDDEGNPAILEIKTASEYVKDEWIEHIPVYYQTQVQHYLCVTGLAKAYVAALIGGNCFKIYELDADLELHQMLIAVEQDFWNKVENGIRPDIDGSDASKAILDELFTGGNQEKFVLPDEAESWIDAYFTATADEDAAKARKQEASNHIKDLIGDHESATCQHHKISWKSITTERLDTKLFKAEEPQLYEKYVKVTNSRRFSIR